MMTEARAPCHSQVDTGCVSELLASTAALLPFWQCGGGKTAERKDFFLFWSVFQVDNIKLMKLQFFQKYLNIFE